MACGLLLTTLECPEIFLVGTKSTQHRTVQLTEQP